MSTACAAAVGVVAGVVGLSGCAAGGGEQDATATVQRFFAAIEGDDAASACAQLTPRTRQDIETSEGKSCAEALPTDQLRPGKITGADVWSDRAQVDTSTGVVFLAEFDSRWLIAAIGCTPEDEAPADCVVSD
jgi:hypothetical protein